MATFLFGLAAAATYGAADFLGGLMSRRVDAAVVVFFSQLFGALPLAVAVALMGGEATPHSLRWGAASGIAGGAGILFLFRALGRGRMSALAPITALSAAGIPVVFGIVTGQRPRPVVLLGAVIALVAVGLISSGESREGAPMEVSRAALADALAAGICFGAFFILLDQTESGSGMWPLASARVGSLTLVSLLLLLRRHPPRADASARPGIAAAGCLDVAANIFYVLAARSGLLPVAAVLTSLYPGGTVLLARVVLNERLTRLQVGGLAMGATGVALIGAG